MKIEQDRVTENFADFIRTPKTDGTFAEGLPDTIVIHYTAGSSIEGSIDTFKDESVRASAHILIDKDGSIVQMAPFSEITWHAGESAWLDRTALNRYSIGIEIVNAGRLEKNGNRYRSWFGRTYDENEVVEAIHRNENEISYWERYSEEQIETVFGLCKLLSDTYDIRFILGHEEISPGRKSDPGPAFPLDKLRERILFADRSDTGDNSRDVSEKGVVIAGALNIRSGPSTNHSTIAPPLSRNTGVKIESEMNGWYKVRVPLTGWVSKQFVKKVDS
ncbi:MAG: N-acetylmuramoyl-L-alanine amidase [Balneolaceae bacterium]|nr:N-acetylmuramoyl-L-alanine amidase [Balneolaceae bacterium]